MPYVPALPPEIAQRILARFTALTGADTLALNGDMATLVGLFAEELSMADRRANEFTLAHHFDPVMPEDVLEQRINQLPLAFPKRRPASAAFGGDFSLRRGTTSASYTYDVGQIRVSPYARPDLVYTNADPVTFGVGQSTADNVNFVCSTPGSVGSYPPGSINVVVESGDSDIIGCTNTASITGRDTEDKTSLVNRALRWLGSLAQSQRDALESVALNFISSNGQTILHARCWSDPDRPGYSRLVVDDGSGMAGQVGIATTISGTVPDLEVGRRYQFVFDAPAVTSPRLTLGANTYTASLQAWSVLEESGVMWLKPDPASYGIVISPGMSWSIGGHQVYKAGSFIAELQSYINQYCVAAGTRVVVQAPMVQAVTIRANVVFTSGNRVSRNELFTQIKDVILTFVRNLAMGEPLYLFKLIPELQKIEGVENIIFDHGDKYPGSPAHRLITYPSLIILR